MSVSYGFYNSVDGDRRYDAIQMSSIFDGVIQDGVFMNTGNKLTVSPGVGLTVIVADGRAWFNHTWTLNDSDLIVPIDSPEAVLNRIDAVILEVDGSTRTNSIKVVKGIPATVPSRPALINAGALHQYPLAYVTVPTGITEFVPTQIANMVGTSSCPYVIGVIQSTNIDNIVAQWESQFNIWFEEMKDQLTTDAAGNLQVQITELDSEVTELSENIIAANNNEKSGWQSRFNNWTYWSSSVQEDRFRIPYSEQDGVSLFDKGTRIKYTQNHALAAYFPFNGNSTPSVGVYTVNNVGSPTYEAGKFSGSAIRLNGINQGLAISGNLTAFKPPIDPMSTITEFTLGMWVCVKSLKESILLSSGIWTDNYGFSVGFDTSGKLVFTIGTGTASISLKSQTVLLGSVEDQWWHVVVTFRNGLSCIYMNGLLESSRYDRVELGYHATEHYLRIGCQVAGSGGGTNTKFFDGKISDLFYMSNYALDELTIQKLNGANTRIGIGPIPVTKMSIVTYVETYGIDGTVIVTGYHGTDYRFVDAPITDPCISNVSVPLGFPKSPNKWTICLKDKVRRVQLNPAANTWYDFGLLFWMDLMQGDWYIKARLIVSAVGPGTGTEIVLALSRDINDTTIVVDPIDVVSTFTPLASFRNLMELDTIFSQVWNYSVVLVAKVTNAGVTSLALENDKEPGLMISAVCAYL